LEVRKRVIRAREKAIKRSRKINAELSNKEIEKFCALSKEDQNFLEEVIEKFKLSLRSYHRIIKISRTIADLNDCESINTDHLKEAVGYRREFR
jgi:magnesium chelatase family protein